VKAITIPAFFLPRCSGVSPLAETMYILVDETEKASSTICCQDKGRVSCRRDPPRLNPCVHASRTRIFRQWFHLHVRPASWAYKDGMGFQANVLKVMIASPGDVAAERGIVTEALYRWNEANAVSRELMLQPVKWETHSSPQMGAHPQSIINERLLIDAGRRQTGNALFLDCFLTITG
jgi:hypothetical protein